MVNKKVDVSWDTPRPGAAVRSMYDTIKVSLTDPVSFFEAVARGEGALRPWIYAIIISVVVFACAASYQAGFAALQFGTDIANEIKRAIFPTTLLTGPLFVVFFLAFAAIGMPILTTITMLVQAALLHLGLMILGAAKRDFSATWRTVCYSAGPQVIQIIPLLGSLVAGLWVVVLNIIGLKVVHETTYAKSTVAVFLPLIVCCGVILLVMTTVAGGIFAALVTK